MSNPSGETGQPTERAVYECWNCSWPYKGELCVNPECSEPADQESMHGARIKGEGYDVQLCTSEPLTDSERAALHEFYRATTSRGGIP